MVNLRTGLGIGEVSRLTGVPSPTLRAWERRHGFPRPLRLQGGHRRYDPGTVETIRRFAELRGLGMSVGRALEAAAVHGGSLVASISTLMPAARPANLSRSAMLAVSRAIEDEIVETGRRPVLFGAFQRPEAFGRAARRWARIAPHTAVSVAMAPGVAPGVAGRLRTVDLPPRWALAHEWAVISDGSPMACLVGAEGADPTAAPFWAMWSTHPVAVRQVSSAVWRSIRSSFPKRLAAQLDARLDAVPERGAAVMSQSVALSSRIVEYLDASANRGATAGTGSKVTPRSHR